MIKLFTFFFHFFQTIIFFGEYEDLFFGINQINIRNLLSLNQLEKKDFVKGASLLLISLLT